MQGKQSSSIPSKKTAVSKKKKTQASRRKTQNESIQVPSMYNILLVDKKHPEASTITQVLAEFFHMKEEKAELLTTAFVDSGIVVCGRYTKEVAENKIAEVREFSRQFNQTFDCVIRKEGTYAFKKPRA